MNNKKIQIRAQQKHDIEANWNNNPNFIPLNGEIIIYDEDENNPTARVKIGDGETTINNLPFTFLPLNTEVHSAKVENETLILGKTQYIDTINKATNLLPALTEVDGSILNGVGYIQGKRISASGGGIVNHAEMTLSGRIYCQPNDILRIYSAGEAINMNVNNLIGSFDEQDNLITTVIFTEFPVGMQITKEIFGDFSYIRFCCKTINENTFVTINESKNDYLVPNLFDPSKPGFSSWDGYSMFTNWIPFKGSDNDNNGTIYHIKTNTSKENSPYKFKFSVHNNGDIESALIYGYNANRQPLTISNYDDSVKIIQHHTTDYQFIQFEFREDVTYKDLIITANHRIIK